MSIPTREIKRIIRTKYAWPGGYALFLITDDGAALCCTCARTNYKQICYSVRHKLRDGWRVVAWSNTADDTTVFRDQADSIICDHCEKQIE